MLILGVVLLVIGAVLLVLGLFTTDDNGAAAASYIGLDLGATTVFVLGLISGLLLLTGLALCKWGGKRSLRQAKERRRLVHRLEEVENDRREEH